MHRRCRQLADQVCFMLTIRPSIRIKDFVKPDGGRVQNIRSFPGVPGQVGLSFANHKSPIDGSDMVLLGDREDSVESAAD